MVKKIRITTRIGWKKVVYVEEISDNHEVMVYEKARDAKNAFEAMSTKEKLGKITYDSDRMIIRTLPGLKEEEIYNKLKEDIENARKNKVLFLKIKYEEL